MKIVSFGGLAINDDVYTSSLLYSYQQPGKDISFVARHGGPPVATAVNYTVFALPPLEVTINTSGDFRADRRALFAAFDTSTAAKALVVTDDDDTNERYLMCFCRQPDQKANMNTRGYVFSLVAANEQNWRSTTTTVDAWEMENTGVSHNVTVGGDLDVNPIYRFTPLAAKVNGALYTRFIGFTYLPNVAYNQCPVQLTLNTAALLSAGKITDEDNISVFVNGKEVRRWFDAATWNTTTSKVWINLDFAPGLRSTYSGYNDSLNTAMTGASEVTSLTMSSDISAWPDQGMIVIGTEVFAYTGIDRAYRRFTGVTRAVYGTSAAGHAVRDVAYWLQHKIEAVYGPDHAAATEFPDDQDSRGNIYSYDARKPALNLTTSSNQHWYFDDFGDSGGVRGAQWQFTGADEFGVPITYFTGSAAGTDTDPYQYLGIEVYNTRFPSSVVAPAWWSLQLPFSMKLMTGTGYGHYTQKILDETDGWWSTWRKLYNGNTWDFYRIPAPNDFISGDDPILEENYSWSKTYTIEAGGVLQMGLGGRVGWLTATAVHIEFWTGQFATVTGAEQAVYVMAGTLTNQTTGEYITINMPMEVNETLTVDTGNSTVVYSDTGENQYRAVRRNALRTAMLRLVPGTNTLYFHDSDAQDFEIQIEYKERYY